MQSDMTTTKNMANLRVDAPTLRERTLDILRNAICNLDFAPGERLVERKLSELTGVSRTSIREALRHLESEGLIKTIPRKGPTVIDISVEEARQIYQVRGAIESLAGFLLAQQAGPEYLEQLRDCLDALKQATRERNLAASLEANEKFYEIIFKGSGNKVAEDFSRSLRLKIKILRAQVTGRWDKTSHAQSLERMERIVDAIRAKDPEAVRICIIDHSNKSAETLLKILNERKLAPRKSDAV